MIRRDAIGQREIITLFGTDYWMVPRQDGPGFTTVRSWSRMLLADWAPWQEAMAASVLAKQRERALLSSRSRP